MDLVAGQESDHLELARAVSRGSLDGEVLAEQPRRVTVRVRSESGPLIVKLWNLRDVRGLARRALGRTKGRSEWVSLGRLGEAGLPVPRALAFFPLHGAGVRHHEALVVEDLAPCEALHVCMHAASKGGNTLRVQTLDQQVIRITAGMIEKRVLDNDHRLGNFVVRADGLVYRLDFENARTRIPNNKRDELIGVMIGALVSSHAWVTRFEPTETPRFLEQLLAGIPLSGDALVQARTAARAEMDWLQSRSGFVLSADLGW